MILLNVTGYGHHLQALVAQGIDELLDSQDTAMTIMKTPGNGVLNSVLDYLEQRNPGIIQELRLPAMVDEDFIKVSPGSILVVDDAQELDHLPKIAAQLRTHEQHDCQIIYVVTTKLDLVQQRAAEKALA